MIPQSNKVEHIGPISSKIFILGEAPSADDSYFGKPFSDQSGKFLSYCLNLADIDKESCRIGNVCNYHPPRDDFTLLHGTPQLDEGYAELSSYLEMARPSTIIALGNEALRYLTGHAGISDWRGSVLPYLNNSWIIPTYHPSTSIRDGTRSPQVVFDITKAARIAKSGFSLPTHDFIIDPDEHTFELLLDELSRVAFTAADIETIRGTNHVLCMGFALSSSRAFCLKNHYPLGHGLEEEFRNRIYRVLDAVQHVTFHNGGFDTQILWSNGIDINHKKFTYDTMLAQRVLEPELPIGLAFCASIYTDEPFYKGDGKETGKRIPQTLWEYNCKDCIVTFATQLEQEKLFEGDPILQADKDFIFSRIPLMQEFQRNGMLVDQERRDLLKAATEKKLTQSKHLVELATGYSLNFRSHAQVKELLYGKLKLPTKSNRAGGVTADEDAIVSLIQYVQGQIDEKKTEEGKVGWILKLHALRNILEIRGDEKLLSSYLETVISPDGRLRSSYYPAGTDTGRWSCGSSVDGSGLNAQTFPRSSILISTSVKI